MVRKRDIAAHLPVHRGADLQRCNVRGMTANGRSRAARFTQADVARALKAAQRAKMPIASVRIEPDGSINLIPGEPPVVPPSQSQNPWDGEP